MSCCGGKPCEKPAVAEETPSLTDDDVIESVKTYYGKTVKTVDDLKTGACIPPKNMSRGVKAAMGLVHDDIIVRSYGCGLPIPEAVEECKILDLGCGTGRDVFVLSKLVGPNGKVIGIDMTQEQLDVATEYVPYHMQKFGFAEPNVEFKKAFMEDLAAVGIPDDYFDCAVSNCVVNLCQDKGTVLAEVFRVLKKGGELYFSDIYSDKDVPEEAKKDKEAWGECLSGALCWMDLHEICSAIGFATPVLVSSQGFPIKDPRITELLDGVQFLSATYRLFKPNPDLSGSFVFVSYKGTIAENEDKFTFAKNLIFPKDVKVAVGSELGAVLKASRYGRHLDFSLMDASEEAVKEIMKLNPFCCADPADETPAGSAGCC